MQVGIVGATGAVGREMLSILSQRRFPAERLSLWASSRSAGQQFRYGPGTLTVRPLADTAFRDLDVALFSAGGGTARAFIEAAHANGTVVIDNSSAFRMVDQVPLVIPEVNPADAGRHRGVLANPNCSTIIMAVAIWPLHQVIPVRRMIVCTYQAISGAGAAAMAELREQTRDVLDGKPAQPRVLPHPAAFNLFSHDSAIDDSGYNEEERKMLHETRKIFHQPDLQISATCIRVPILRAHSEAIHVTFERPLSPGDAREILAAAPGIHVVDDPRGNHFPMPVEASGRDVVLVGRLRQDASDPSGCSLALFVSGDQLRKGAALNAIQIADLLWPGAVGATNH